MGFGSYKLGDIVMSTMERCLGGSFWRWGLLGVWCLLSSAGLRASLLVGRLASVFLLCGGLALFSSFFGGLRLVSFPGLVLVLGLLSLVLPTNIHRVRWEYR